ncbi:NifB/NifX family molybdenum-iron cluster-binding protein [Paenibacillus rhizophilus]|uniref:Dinitrogenase iron-molybdenum cofactor biosynthesis domain-containing protein n=1 Tax=Paenibacillus rhizophilus TaxID=1850366 RepID=A0A3N9NWH8_9BACL|nr:NifB/NifX family molybdenum-iron cluster-binding protein [Paenibacillus rhizophilus]RQW08313.1 hypothetical protein EH198_22880 [Paenibacillus rhizophilus]
METIDAADEASRQMAEKQQAGEEHTPKSAGLPASELAAVRIAVATRGGGKVNVHFGHASEFWIYDVSEQKTKLLEVRKVEAYCSGRAECSSPDDKKKIFDDTAAMLGDCQMLLCSGIGDSPRRKLLQKGIAALSGKGGIEELLLESVEFYKDLGI